MKTQIRNLLLALAVLAFSPGQATFGAVTNSITPAAISNTYSGILTFQVTGLTSGDTVVVQKFLDLNTNGVVDAGDLLMQQFQLTDGVASAFTNGATSVTNFNVPGDTDGSANGTITAQLYPGLDFAQEIVGKYLFVLSSPSGHFTPQTNSFSVTNFPFAQSFTGNVVSNSTAVPNAVVILFQPSNGGQNPRGGTIANNSGAYTIAASPGTYQLAAYKSNFMANLNVSPFLTLGAGATITTNVPLTNTTQSISGKVVDTNNPSLGLAGMLVPVQSTNGLLTLAFTDTNGNFVARVTTNAWKLGGDSQKLEAKGYVGLDNKVRINTATGSVAGVSIALPKATAIFYGTVKDNLGNPLSGVHVEGDDNVSNGSTNGLYEFDNSGYTFTNGNYVLGVISGDSWEVYINSQDQTGIYTNYLFTEAPSQQNGGTSFGNRQAVQQNFTGTLATNHITGNVSFNGGPVVGVGVNANATIGGVAYQSHTDTDTNGNYSLNVANGSWSVSINCSGGNDSLDNILGAGTYQCPNSGNVTIANNNGTLNFTVIPANGGQIFGYLTDVYGNGIVGVSIYASDGLGDNYSTSTTGGGYYSIIAVNNTYNVSVDCGQLTTRGFYCTSGNSATVSGGSVEADFTTTPVNTSVYAFTTLHSFLATVTNPNGIYTNSDGASPYGGLLLAGNTLFGTAQSGGTNGNGVVFALGTNLTSFTVVHTFLADATNSYLIYTNNDGAGPMDGLILSGSILYGTANYDGANGNGTVFAVNTNGTGFRVIHTFTALDTATETTNTDGAGPIAGLALSGNMLYGTTVSGGTNGNGTVFTVNTNGSFTVLHTFTALDAATQTTNVDGANPYAGLVLSGGTLYGTAEYGGAGFGTIFAVNTNGTGFTVLYSFTGGNDGANPYAGLILMSNTLYGVASSGGHWGSGALFAINTNGTGFTVMQSFAGGDGGANPYGGLIFSSNVLYGTTVNGGSYNFGTVFAFNISATNFAVLHAFTSGSDGVNPYDGLILYGNTLYGTTSAGGSTGSGTVFGVSIKTLPQSLIISAPVHLSKSQFQMLVAGVAGQNYTVQMTTNLAFTNWSSIYLTNPSSGSFLFTDPNATNKQRSYRIWVGP